MKKKAFIIGIDNYPSFPLSACVSDVMDVSGVLSEKDYFDFEVEICVNQNATLWNIRQGIVRLLDDDADILLLYFAGHGVINEMGGFLLTVDWIYLQDPGLSLELLAKIIEVHAKPTTSVVVILDCCHSGSAYLRSLDTKTSWRTLDNSSIEKSIFPGKGKVLMAACGHNEKAKELKKENHGLFTFHLLQGLLGEAANNEGKVTPMSLYDYIAAAFSDQNLQTPVFRGDISGSIVLGKGFVAKNIKNSHQYIIDSIIKEASSMLDEYYIPLSDEEWSEKGFIECCARINDIIEWQREKIMLYSNIQKSDEFRKIIYRTNAELSKLGILYPGIKTVEGEVVNRLGSGSFGTVWKIKREDNSHIAYKVYNSGEISMSDKLRHFQRGYRANKSLIHKNIVQVLQFTTAPVGFFMEYIEGYNLRDAYDIQMMDYFEILIIIAKALKFAHLNGIIHRDVKPENILLKYDESSGELSPFLVDFDLAWFNAASQVTRMGIGSFHYAAPEQFASPGSSFSHAPTTDIYAFIQLLFFCLTQNDPYPYSIKDNIDVLRRISSGKFHNEATEIIISMYMKCSDINPRNRMQSFDDIIPILEAIKRLIQ